MSSTQALRLAGSGRYTSGLLLTPALAEGSASEPVHSPAGFAITAAHFLRGSAGEGRISIRGDGFRGTVAAHQSIFGTDIGVVRLTHPAPPTTLLPLARSAPRAGSLVTTYGYGGTAASQGPKEISGRALVRVPFAMSRDFRTRVRHGMLLRNSPVKAIKGDSGGPVISRGQVVAVQSLITDPFGVNLGIATVQLLGPHLKAIAAAMASLSGGGED